MANMYGPTLNGVGQIGVNNILLTGALDRFKNAGNDIETATSLRDPTVCRELVLSDWVDLCTNVSLLLILYKDLIDKDVESIRESQNVLNDADRKRAHDILNSAT